MEVSEDEICIEECIEEEELTADECVETPEQGSHVAEPVQGSHVAGPVQTAQGGQEVPVKAAQGGQEVPVKAAQGGQEVPAKTPQGGQDKDANDLAAPAKWEGWEQFIVPNIFTIPAQVLNPSQFGSSLPRLPALQSTLLLYFPLTSRRCNFLVAGTEQVTKLEAIQSEDEKGDPKVAHKDTSVDTCAHACAHTRYTSCAYFFNQPDPSS